MVRSLSITPETLIRLVALIKAESAAWADGIPDDARIVSITYDKLPPARIELRIYSEAFETTEPLELRGERLML